MITRSLSRLGGVALDLLYPPRCSLCDKQGSFVCDACVKSLPRTEGRRCDVCWLPLRGDVCATCAEHPTRLTRLRSVFRYEGDVRRLVHAFKFGGQSALAPALTAQLTLACKQYALESDLVVPVPMPGGRRRTRGYNQAALLAHNLGRDLDLPMGEALRRRGNATPQASSTSAEQRRRNVIGAFEVARRADVAGRRVLLIDDVATTGATLGACADALLTAGAREVTGLTLARED